MEQRRDDRGLESAERALEPAEKNSEPAWRALEPAGRPRAIWEGQLRGQAGWGKKSNVCVMWWYHSIGHRSLQGRCPKTE